MQTDIRQISVDEKEILRNLLEKYLYEFSLYDKRDVNALGLYGYNYLDNYWTQEEGRFAFFIYVKEKLAGFAMVNDHRENDFPTDYTMGEFFILSKYRHMGIGKQLAHDLFARYRGAWQLQMHPDNIASVRFWKNVVSSFTNGKYTLHEAGGGNYDDGTPGDALQFSTK